ncbi:MULTISPECIES: pantoate--beta-alanine ligase [Clostridium]|uniref:pantoate--beta-alanine ligase n=1 Tax=Clostridium TaxID=1485 RepID=UPI0004231BF3|nr:pantoate--beta-alanine ligase [Clostridium cadaveris]MDU4952718.1 pantoate--beta-alanine ligase [Clostridium sp.]NME64928.1 pantoate--beta-alanine ligase [Clostridium cadaveris]UFH65267.1 pantoate--beta-alanine ligase [Clostridium cadaveris]
MKVSKTVDEVRLITKQWRAEGYTVGLVPTMGYLHEGHGSLIERCRKENDKVIVSIFVNPTQFGANEDLGAYPRDFERDKDLCEKLGCDLIFHPEPSEMYVDPHAYVNINGLSDYLCGKSRPVHFKGVCTVVSKLFNIVHPHNAYFGEKDAQQLAIIKKMVKDLNFDVNVVGCPIVREEDGLAKSSRNAYLSEEERKSALCLSRAIKKGQEIIRNSKKASEVIDAMKAIVNDEKDAKIDYIEVVDAVTMQPISEIKGNVLVAMAVYIGKTRLIDNFTWEAK